MCVNNLPRVALDSGAAGIRTRDLLIASTTATPPSHTAAVDVTLMIFDKQHKKLSSNCNLRVTDDIRHAFYSWQQAVREAATICPRPLKLNIDLLTLKVVSESRVTWATSVPF